MPQKANRKPRTRGAEPAGGGTAAAAIGPLHDAVRSGDAEALSLLLTTRTFDRSELSEALRLALELGTATEVLRLLLGAGAEADARNVDGETALHVALRLRRLEALAALVVAGADLHASNARGQSAALVASRDPMLLDALARAAAARINAAPVPSSPPSSKPDGELIGAVRERSAERIRRCLSRGADVNAVDADKRTPLHHASETGDAEIVALLIHSGARVDERDRAERQPLHEAAIGNRDKVVKQLLKAGAPPDARDAAQRTPLLLASMAGKNRVCDVLVNAGADVHAADVHGETPLSWVKKSAKFATGRAKEASRRLVLRYTSAAKSNAAGKPSR